MSSSLIVFCNAPDRDCAEKIANRLMECRLAACVNILAPCQSVYRWQGRVEHEQEVPLLIKTTRDAYAGLEAEIRALHPYELPEVLALPIDQGLPAYLAWLESEVGNR